MNLSKDKIFCNLCFDFSLLGPHSHSTVYNSFILNKWTTVLVHTIAVVKDNQFGKTCPSLLEMSRLINLKFFKEIYNKMGPQSSQFPFRFSLILCHQMLIKNIHNCFFLFVLQVITNKNCDDNVNDNRKTRKIITIK